MLKYRSNFEITHRNYFTHSRLRRLENVQRNKNIYGYSHTVDDRKECCVRKNRRYGIIHLGTVQRDQTVVQESLGGKTS